MYKIVLMRHGESQWNLENRFTGWVDVDLTEKGRLEAAKAGEILKAEGFEFDITDDLVLIDIKINSHDIAAFCISYGTNTTGILNLTYISWMLEMIHNFLCIHNFVIPLFFFS